MGGGGMMGMGQGLMGGGFGMPGMDGGAFQGLPFPAAALLGPMGFPMQMGGMPMGAMQMGGMAGMGMADASFGPLLGGLAGGDLAGALSALSASGFAQAGQPHGQGQGHGDMPAANGGAPMQPQPPMHQAAHASGPAQQPPLGERHSHGGQLRPQASGHGYMSGPDTEPGPGPGSSDGGGGMEAPLDQLAAALADGKVLSNCMASLPQVRGWGGAEGAASAAGVGPQSGRGPSLGSCWGCAPRACAPRGQQAPTAPQEELDRLAHALGPGQPGGAFADGQPSGGPHGLAAHGGSGAFRSSPSGGLAGNGGGSDVPYDPEFPE